MDVARGSVCLLAVLGISFMYIGSSTASHKTKPVPLPENVTIWMMCGEPPEYIERTFIGCYEAVEQHTKIHGNSYGAQCDGFGILNECVKMNVSIHCPDVYRQYYREMQTFLPTIIFVCRSNMGLISLEEWEHIAWEHLEFHYNEWLNMTRTEAPPNAMTESSSEHGHEHEEEEEEEEKEDVDHGTSEHVPETSSNKTETSSHEESETGEDDVTSGDDDDKMVTGRMKDYVRKVTERFLAATTAAPEAKEAPRKQKSLMDILTTAAADVPAEGGSVTPSP